MKIDYFADFYNRFVFSDLVMTWKGWESLPAVPGSLTGPNGSLGHLPGVAGGLPNSVGRSKNRVKCGTKRQKNGSRWFYDIPPPCITSTWPVDLL